MPYKKHADYVRWNREYQRKRREAGRTEPVSCEQAVLSLIRQYPGVFDAAMLYEHLGRQYAFAAILKIIETLRNGLIDYARAAPYGRGITRKLVPVTIPKIILTPTSSPAMTEDRS